MTDENGVSLFIYSFNIGYIHVTYVTVMRVRRDHLTLPEVVKI